MKAFFFGACSPDGACAQAFYAIFRAGIGISMALLHGWGKVKGLSAGESGFVGLIEGMGLPAPELWAWLVALTEFLGGLLIAVGLLTRPAALGLLITMGVAFFHTKGGSPSEGELAMLFGFASLLFVSMGSGKYGIDASIRKG